MPTLNQMKERNDLLKRTRFLDPLIYLTVSTAHNIVKKLNPIKIKRNAQR